MSDMLCHMFCGQLIIENLKNSEIKEILKKEEKYFLLGSMGGDFFFYYNAFPWKRDGGINKIGSKFHHERVNEIFLIFYDYLMTIKEKEYYEKALSYVFGFICHHALDSVTHPYIIYSSGIVRKKDANSLKYKFRHKRLEALIDYYMIEILNKENELDKIDDYLNLNNDDINIINDIYTFTLNRFINYSLPSEVYKESFSDARSLYNLSRKNCNFKLSLFGLIEKIINKKYALTQIILKPSKEEKSLDVLNLNHQFWSHPCIKEEKSNYSYPELFNKAVNLGVKNINEYIKLIQRENANINDMDKIFKGIGFDTGKNNFSVKDIKYVGSVFYDRKFEEIG